MENWLNTLCVILSLDANNTVSELSWEYRWRVKPPLSAAVCLSSGLSTVRNPKTVFLKISVFWRELFHFVYLIDKICSSRVKCILTILLNSYTRQIACVRTLFFSGSCVVQIYTSWQLLQRDTSYVSSWILMLISSRLREWKITSWSWNKFI